MLYHHFIEPYFKISSKGAQRTLWAGKAEENEACCKFWLDYIKSWISYINSKADVTGMPTAQNRDMVNRFKGVPRSNQQPSDDVHWHRWQFRFLNWDIFSCSPRTENLVRCSNKHPITLMSMLAEHACSKVRVEHAR